MAITFLTAIICFLLTIVGVDLFRRWSVRRELLDHPNERSSHTRPTPRGGGIVICLVALASLSAFYANGAAEVPWAYFAGAVLVAGISWLDDLGSVSALVRFACHTLAAGLVVFSLGGFETLHVPFYGTLIVGGLGQLIAFLWIVWMINAYNFMDGIDGLAAMQAVTGGVGWLAIGYFYSLESITFFGGVLAAANAAFLFHNWQPAKIFMGDVGSAFLGFTFAVIPLLGVQNRELHEFNLLFPIFTGLFVWFFLFDSVFTFFRRLLQGEKVWQAHRMHIYQELVIAGYSHQAVTILYGVGSCLIIFVMFAALTNPRYFGNIIWSFVMLLTIVLLFIWRKSKRILETGRLIEKNELTATENEL